MINKILINIVQQCITLSINLGTEALITCSVLSTWISDDEKSLVNPMIPFVTILLPKYPFH